MQKGDSSRPRDVARAWRACLPELACALVLAPFVLVSVTGPVAATAEPGSTHESPPAAATTPTSESPGADARSATGGPAITRRGPFEIRPVTRQIGAGGFPNVFRLFARETVSEWIVFHRGAPLRIETESGSVGRFDEAWFLDGGSDPAVLVATGDFFLIREEQGRLAVAPIAEGQGGVLATYQWLDAAAGQPGPEQSIGLRDRRRESRVLAGGSLLLLDAAAVLDLATRAVHPVRAPLLDPVVGRFGVAGEPARALSPDRSQYVLVGSEEIDGRERSVLVVVDYRRDAGIVVPFEREATGFESVWDVTPAWLAQHFDWLADAGGGLRLVAKPASTPPAEGRAR